MEEIINKEIAQGLMKTRGEVRGLALKSHGDFILEEKGPEALVRLEEFMKELGSPLDHQKIGLMGFYPLGLELIELLAIKKLFNFGDEKFEQIGAFGSKISLIMKLFMQYFASITLMARQTPKIWEEYYTRGKLETLELSQEKRYLILQLSDFPFHPLHLLHLKGYFASVVKMVLKKSVTCEEKKHLKDDQECHQFIIKW
jgi:hypothetical protein